VAVGGLAVAVLAWPDQAPPAAATSLLQRADYYAGIGQASNNERAIALYRQALQVDPESSAARRGLARALSAQGCLFNGSPQQMREALALADSERARAPHDGATYALRGYAHDCLGRMDDAVADYARAIQLDPADERTRASLAYLQQEQGHLSLALRANLARLAAGAAAHDALLWGARGMGKSALVRAAVSDVQADSTAALALVQLAPGTLPSFPALIAALAGQPRAFLLMIDDLGFGADGRAEMLALRSLLDGGVAPRPAHIRLAVTANRRAIVERRDNSAALHERDERDDALALADRFGLTLGFHPCDRETYLAILTSYAAPHGLGFDAEEALAFAIQRGNRSGRTALQYATELAGRAGISL
jgi:predicted AAA+ superfamily ATPase